jgi:pimeloyl-ACP methyl ester carboxylesterase
MSFRGFTNCHEIGGHLTTVISLAEDRARVAPAAMPGATDSGATPRAGAGAGNGGAPTTGSEPTPIAAREGMPAGAPDAAQILTVGGVRIRYRTVGSGKPLLLLHGWGTSLDTFSGMTDDLAKQFSVTAFDFPGHGGSGMPPAAWAVDDFVELTLGVMAALGVSRTSVLGHSFGGRVAIKLAAAHPEVVDRLVLVDSAGVPPPQTLTRRVKRLASRFANASGRLGRPGQAVRRAIVERIASTDYLNAGPLRGTFLAVIREDLRPVLPGIKAPTLLIWGESDGDTTLADARAMEKLIPGSRLLVLKNAGHFSYLDQYGRFRLAIIPFLND